MATSSFFHEVVIADSEAVAKFLGAMEKSRSSGEVKVSVPCRELKGTEIKEFFGVE